VALAQQVEMVGFHILSAHRLWQGLAAKEDQKDIKSMAA
jgi:hypothetical protein